MSKVWRILSIDGGGIRGIIPASVLAAIEERTGKPIAQLFDLIAGTSTGGILALGLTKPGKSGGPEFSARQLCELYMKEIPVIFGKPQTWWGNLLSPKYDCGPLRNVLAKSVGDCRLQQAITDVLIPCYDIEHRSPHIFKSRWAKWQKQYDFFMRDVAIATSATPTLFRPARIARSDAGGSLFLVDGGVFANNPTMYAMAEVNSMCPADDDQYFVLSLGTGESTRKLTNDLVSLWGYVQWSRPMLELVMESNSEAVHEQMKIMLPTLDRQRYYRIQIDLPEHPDCTIDMGSKQNMQALLKSLETFFADPQYQQDLNDICQMLVEFSETEAKSIAQGTSTIFSGHKEHQVAICYEEEDAEQVAYPMAAALRREGIESIVDKYILHHQVNIRRLVVKATENEAICVIVVSPTFLKSIWARKQIKWLYARTLSCNNLIVPILHGIARAEIPAFAKSLGWSKLAIENLQHFIEFSLGSTTEGIDTLTHTLLERIGVKRDDKSAAGRN